MSKFLKKHVVIFFIFTLIFCSIIPSDIVNANNLYRIQYNDGNISEVGKQGKNQCMAYALAYCRTILDGKIHYGNEYWKDGVGGMYGWADYTKAGATSKQGLLRIVYDQISNGYPVCMYVTGKYRTESYVSGKGYYAPGDHWVTVVGYKASANPQALKISDFYILDPGTCDYDYLVDDNNVIRIDVEALRISNKGTSLLPLYENVYTDEITNSNAKLHAKLRMSTYCSQVGFYISKKSDMSGATRIDEKANMNVTHISYDLNKWYGTLEKGTKYYYQIYAVVNGVEQKSEIYSFTTTGKVPTAADYFKEIYVENISDTNAKINARLHSSTYVDKAGFYISKNANMSNSTRKEEASNMDVLLLWYDMNKWYGALDKGTTYFYQMFIVVNGTEIKSDINSFITTGDGQVPVISKVWVTDVTRDGYTVNVTAADNVGVDKVCFPSWTSYNFQDDLFTDWHITTAVTKPTSGNTYSYRVNVSDHNNEGGEYVTHVYVFDAAGNHTYNTDVLLNIDRNIYLESFALNESNITLNVNATKTLKVTSYTPSNVTVDTTASWKSSNTSVAIVSNKGVVTAIAPGTATITCTVAGKTQTCKVTVEPNFQIITQPGDKEVNENAYASFAVSAQGKNVTYQWQYKLPNSTEWKNSGMTGSNTNTISVQGTAARNGYQYRCIIKDQTGNTLTSNAATLSVKVNVVITSHPASTTVNENQNAVFTVIAAGNDLKYQWQYRLNSNGEWKVSGMAGAKTNSITVQGTAARNGYQYRCVVTDRSGKQLVSNAATLLVKVNTVFAITSQPTDKSVNEGGNATFAVKATGNGLTYQWQYRTSSTTEWKKSGMVGATTASITVQGTTARNGYQYRCVVKDANGKQIVSNAANLAVKVGTGFVIISQPANHSVTEGSKVTFAVTATGNGLTYQWQYKLPGTNQWKVSGMTGAKTASITVEATAARNGYQYRCVVFDGTGARIDSNPGSLTVSAGQTNKLAITSQPESKTVALNENATYTVVAEGEGLIYQWQYRTSATAEWKKSGMVGSTTNSITVQGTTARNGYQYRCVVKDANGKQVVSQAADLIVN